MPGLLLFHDEREEIYTAKVCGNAKLKVILPFNNVNAHSVVKNENLNIYQFY